jgi:hypothetical protein
VSDQNVTPSSESTGAADGQEPAGSAPGVHREFGSAPGTHEAFGSAPPAPSIQAPSIPAPPNPAPPGEVLPDAPVAPAGKGGAAKWIIGGSVALVVAIVAIVVILFSVLRGGDPYKVVVGDCVDQSQFSDKLAQVPDQQTVACTDKKATHRVIGVVDNQPGTALDNEAVCDAWPQTAGRIWLGEPGKTGKIYCLVKIGD